MQGDALSLLACSSYVPGNKSPAKWKIKCFTGTRTTPPPPAHLLLSPTDLTCPPSEKCVDQYKAAGSGSSLFLPEHTKSHDVIAVKPRLCGLREGGAAGGGGNTPEAKVKEPFHWLFENSCRPASCLCQVFLYITLDLPPPRVAAAAAAAAAAASLKQPVLRSHIGTECEFWTGV